MQTLCMHLCGQQQLLMPSTHIIQPQLPCMQIAHTRFTAQTVFESCNASIAVCQGVLAAAVALLGQRSHHLQQRRQAGCRAW